MGRKGNLFSKVKKAFSPEPKEKEEQREAKTKKKWFGKHKLPSSGYDAQETLSVSLLPPPDEVKSIDINNDEQSKQEISVTQSIDAVPEVEVSAAEADLEVVEASIVTPHMEKRREEVAAVKIQTAFRGYLARRALRALRGLVRLKSLVQGPVVKRQATNTLRCMQTLARVQSQIRSRRIRMSEENQALQRQLLQKRAKELENLKMGDDWDDSLQSKEQIEASLQSKQDAATRRERALAYAFSHQQIWKNSSKSPNTMFIDSSNPTWGWSWLERWMAARPWESQSITEKQSNNDHSSVKSASIYGGEINKAYARYQLNSENPSPATSQKTNQTPRRQSPSTPTFKSGKAGRLKSASPKVTPGPDDDSKSMFSIQSDKSRRHSFAGSSIRDDESLASYPSLPSYMVPTASAKAKLRLQSPLGLETDEVSDKGSLGAAKKRLSYPASPARPRRHSGPPKVEPSSIVEQKGEVQS